MAGNLKSQLFSGVFYTALAKYSGVVISLVVAGVLARLLSPDDFGIVAIATVIIAFFNLFTDMGVSPAIVQHKTLTREELSDIFSFVICRYDYKKSICLCFQDNSPVGYSADMGYLLASSLVISSQVTPFSTIRTMA